LELERDVRKRIIIHNLTIFTFKENLEHIPISKAFGDDLFTEKHFGEKKNKI